MSSASVVDYNIFTLVAIVRYRGSSTFECDDVSANVAISISISSGEVSSEVLISAAPASLVIDRRVYRR